MVVRLRGTLNRHALQRALDVLTERHEILRTTFVNDGGSAKQRVIAEGSCLLHIVDLSTSPPAERDALVESQKLDEAMLAFDLRTGPLIRGRLVRLSDELSVLIIAMHHIVSDGWSMGIFINELSRLYSADVEGKVCKLPPLPIQYGDYAQWQREWLEGEVSQKQLSYWRTHLQGAPPEIELPTDRSRPAAFSYRGANSPVALDQQLCVHLRAFAQRHGVTLFMILYAAWAILLSRLSGQPDVVIGTPVANRRRPELEGLIGFFVSTLPLRVEVSLTATLADFLQRVRETTLGAYDNQDIPFEQVVEAMQPQRSLSRHPIFQTAFALQSVAADAWRLSGLTATAEEIENETAKFDLTFLLEEKAEGISGSLNYSSDLFDRNTVQRWLACFEVLLRSMVHGEMTRVGELQFVPDPELRRVRDHFNATQAPYPRDKLIHELFEEQVTRAPNAIAVVCEEQALSYGELNAAANRLAHYLEQRGTRPGEHTPIIMQRSLQMLVAHIAILKCGAAYVPIDPTIPIERQVMMVSDCGARLVIADHEARAELQRDGVQWINCSECDYEIAMCSAQNPQRKSLERPAAYVMYTSGSTGVPKGVIVPHHAVNRLAINNGYAEIGSADCIAHYSNPAFDASTFEIWGALLNGARVLIVPQESVLDPRRFAEVLTTQRVTLLWMTIGLFTQYVESLASVFPRLRYLIVGGDIVDTEVVRRVMRNGPPRHLLNAYGPTECTTFSTTYLIEAIDESATSLPIGRPISNAQIYVLDHVLKPVPVGVTGDIYIGGAGVALGYLNRPELTADRFIPDPFGAPSGARLYKSGDLGRWRSDGNLEFIGRNDQQVKIRGFRIELGEIEAHLARHPGVKEAVVVVREDAPGDKRLVAYVILREIGRAQATIPVETLRAHVKAALPEYMVPGAFVMLERMPLTPNGKVDRRALPAPASDAYASRQYERPRGEVEEILAGIWQSLLKVERIGGQDNFFELGGHSLLIVQMMERLRQTGLSADVRSIYESPTLSDLACTLVRRRADRAEVPPNLIPEGCNEIVPELLTLVDLNEQHIGRIVRTVPGGAANIQDIYPLAPLQEGILFHHLLDGERGDTYVLPKAFSLASRKRVDDLVAALQSVIDRHDIFRTCILWEQLPRPLQVVLRHVTLPVVETLFDESRDSLEQVKEWMRPQCQRLDLRQAPLMRLNIASDATGQWFALLQLHHVVIDHVAIETLTAEVVAHLEGRTLRASEAAPYREHVARVLAHARNWDSDAFFRKKLAEIVEPTAPFGLLDVHRDGARIEDAYQELDAVLSQRVLEQARRLAVSAATLFHAAWSLVLAHTTARDDVVFGSVLLGRLQVSASTQRTLGMFINTLPLRLQLRGVTAKDLVRQAQRELIDLLGHEQASLSAAQRCSGVFGSTPLFSTLLNFRHSVPRPEAQWARASGLQVIASLERTNYPITLSIDDLNERFRLKAQTDCSIAPRRITEYLHTAVISLVTALEQAPETAALALTILPPSERQQVLQSFNATAADVSDDLLVHQLVESQARQTPDAVAVMHDGLALTYRELNARADRLAEHLRERAVPCNGLVGICLDRSLDMVVALVGILKAGAAYVPLDPNYPPERLHYMLSDAAPNVVLASGRAREALPATTAEIIDLSHPLPESAGQAERCGVDGSLSADSLVYVIYTSGSTGQPKGTAMPHRAMVNLLEWHRQAFGCGAGVRVLQFAALSFDVAFQEIFSTLSSGGTLVLLDEWIRRDARALLDLLIAQSVERLFVPPLMLQSMAEQFKESGATAPSLRDIIVAGEQLRVSPEIVAFFTNLNDCHLHNHYGPTETHVVTAATLSGDPGAWPQFPAIGRPIANTRIYVLDCLQQPVPIGVPGEVYIAGANVARGYLNRPELTQTRFISEPFVADPHARMYRTGDIGRWRADGSIEYLGRNDDQVKIRGYRIELGEIETQLGRHAEVREAAVVAREDVSGAKRLVAYLTTRDQGSPTAEELRAHLKSVLPDYMVPSAFVLLEKLPLTPSGKLDRRSLPAPDFGLCAGGRYEQPEGQIEESLAQIWRETLHVGRVGRQDNFFELGGHSLLVLKALVRINESFSCALRVKDVYASPTLGELATRVRGETVENELIDLAREATLEDSIVPAPGFTSAGEKVVLLTGATGFVGRFLLAQLLRDTNATIYCLIRAHSDKQAQYRLKATLTQWDLWQDGLDSRLVAIAGDLRSPRLGIDERTYRFLADRIDSIFHCATSMNHLETYAMAKSANVDSAKELLRLATDTRPKLINYVSTLGVFGAAATDDRRVVTETTPIDHEEHWSSQGYLASKWVSEKLFMKARDRGIPCNIFRLGLVWADAEQGRFDEQQHVYMMLKSCLLSGCGIENYRYPLPPTPVDYVARAIVCLAGRHCDGQGTFHISSAAQAAAGVFERCGEIMARPLELMSYYDWIREMKRLHHDGRSLPAVPLIDFAFDMDEETFRQHQHRKRSSANVHFDLARTHRELEQAGIVAPVLDDEMLGVCLQRLICGDAELRELAENMDSLYSGQVGLASRIRGGRSSGISFSSGGS